MRRCLRRFHSPLAVPSNQQIASAPLPGASEHDLLLACLVEETVCNPAQVPMDHVQD